MPWAGPRRHPPDGPVEADQVGPRDIRIHVLVGGHALRMSLPSRSGTTPGHAEPVDHSARWRGAPSCPSRTRVAAINASTAAAAEMMLPMPSDHPEQLQRRRPSREDRRRSAHHPNAAPPSAPFPRPRWLDQQPLWRTASRPRHAVHHRIDDQRSQLRPRPRRPHHRRRRRISSVPAPAGPGFITDR